MSTESLVSVVIPCYNGERFLARAIDSIIQQTYPNWELIIIDDGSTDNSKAVVQTYLPDRRIIFLENENNLGIPKTKNKGIAVAQGGYLAFLDQDDIWMPTKLKCQVDRFPSRNSNVGLVCTGIIFINEHYRIENIHMGLDDSNQKTMLNNLYWSPLNSSSVMLVTRQCLERIGPFDESLVGWDDFELLMRIASQFEVRYVKEPLVKKMLRPNSAQDSPIVRNEMNRVFAQVRVLHPFLFKYKDFNRVYFEAIESLENGKKSIARQKLKEVIINYSGHRKARLIYLLTFLPWQSGQAIRAFLLYVKYLLLRIRIALF